MLNKPTVSVIIPVYNVEQYLSKCLDSVINQTFKNIEIICINDGSTDNSLKILNEYAMADKRIIVINQENSGVYAARNKGLQIANGKYISFVDSDDWIEPECYELAVFHMENDSEIKAVNWGANVINQFNSPNTPDSWYAAKFEGKLSPTKEILLQTPGMLWQMLFRNDIIQKNKLNFSDYKLGEDILFLFKYMLNVNYIYYIPQNLYNYVIRPNSAVTKYGGKYNPLYSLKINIKITIELLEYFKERNKLNLFNEIYFPRQLSSIHWALKHSNDKQKETCIEELKKLTQYLDSSLDWGKDIEYIRQNKFYKIHNLNYPYINLGNKILGLKIYRNNKRNIKFSILGIQITLNYQKIFSIKNDREAGEKIINILGLKLKYKKKLKNEVKHFVRKNNAYLQRSDKTKTRRLFLTTGNLSLINALTIIRQLNSTNCEDTLFIYSNMENSAFNECCINVARLHNFKQIYTLYSKTADFREYFIKNQLTEFDEIYFVNIYQFIFLVQELYPNAKWILTDEGAGCALARNEHLNYDRVSKIMMHNYADKIDFLGIEKHNYNKIVPLDKNIFISIARQCAQIYPVDLGLRAGEKAVLFCGSWWEVSGFSREEYLIIQNSIIDKLLKLGYKIFFKPHPRDPRNYIDNKEITILTTTLPLECYNLDVVAVISLYSTASMQTFYFNDIPGFSMALTHRMNKPLQSKWLDILVKKLFEEYTTPIEELFAVNPELYTKEELKKILIEKCENYLKTKPVLSKNEKFKQYAIEKGYKIPEGNRADLMLAGGKNDR